MILWLMEQHSVVLAVASSTSSLGLDPKQVEKPSQFDGDPAVWQEFNFKFVNWTTVLNDRYAEVLPQAEELSEVKPQEGELGKLGRALYAILAGLLTGKDHLILRTVKDLSGYEGWRRIVRE